MKSKLIWLLMAILYWPGTTQPIRQYERTEVICGEDSGLTGFINYVWSDGSVDVRTGFFGLRHVFVKDYRCLRKLT